MNIAIVKYNAGNIYSVVNALRRMGIEPDLTDNAERLAKAVVGSSLVKAAMFGADANWGRVLCAMGYSKAPFRPEGL